jgi:hypothetical protein
MTIRRRTAEGIAGRALPAQGAGADAGTAG